MTSSVSYLAVLSFNFSDRIIGYFLEYSTNMVEHSNQDLSDEVSFAALITSTFPPENIWVVNNNIFGVFVSSRRKQNFKHLQAYS